MLELGRSKGAEATLAALDRSLAVITFDPKGRILSANANFCVTMGYAPEEIVGRHHSLFVDESYARTPEYRVFWERLGRGEFDVREYKRLAKGGREVWIQASYNPVLKGGRVVRVVKVATDITAEKTLSAERAGAVEAISRVQAVVEFKPSGEIVTANENFLSTLGYRLEDVVGRHHRMFMPQGEADLPAYAQFWETLNRGEYVAAEFKRVGQGGREVWIQASYNPVLDAGGRVARVVKYATEVTDRVKAVRVMGEALSGLAAGDMQVRITCALHPAFERMREDFNVAAGQLATTLGAVAAGAGAIRSGAGELAGASDDLARRTERQAAGLEETAAALDQITATVKKTAQGAAHARDTASSAHRAATASSTVVGAVVQAMQGIEASSNQIGRIIGVIDEIAFQTNPLALNAGVVAARAGDAGRGFAVVASEVRALAQRSATAAKEIKELVSNSAQQVASGVSSVAQAGTSLEEIVAHVGELNAIVSDIAAAAQEEAQALGQINTAINDMDQVTQQNAALVEQATAASRTLADEAQELSGAVGRFQLEAATPAPKRTAPRPALAGAPVHRPAPVRALRGGGAALAPAAAAGAWEEF